VHGEVLAKDTVRAKENIIAEKDIKVEGRIDVGDILNVEGDINTNGNFLIKKTPIIRLLPPIGHPTTDPILPPNPGTNPIQVYFGPSPASPLAVEAICDDGNYDPWVPTTNNFGGQIQLYDNTGPGMTYNPGGSILSMVSWFNGSSIDVSGGIGGGSLLMNYFCGKDIYMCTGGNGGVVSTGKNFEIGMPTRNTQTSLNMLIRPDITKAVSIINPSIDNTKSIFEIASNGATYIGLKKPQAPHNDAMLSVDGKIASKSLYVLKVTSWADFVFKQKDLEKLKNVETYINTYKHLPGIPSEQEVLENGYDINEMDAKLLAKIETLYLHIIALEKEINQLKKK
jgi:hypothetical protein